MQRPTTSFLDWTRKFAIEEACLDELTRRKWPPASSAGAAAVEDGRGVLARHPHQRAGLRPKDPALRPTSSSPFAHRVTRQRGLRGRSATPLRAEPHRVTFTDSADAWFRCNGPPTCELIETRSGHHPRHACAPSQPRPSNPDPCAVQRHLAPHVSPILALRLQIQPARPYLPQEQPRTSPTDQPINPKFHLETSIHHP